MTQAPAESAAAPGAAGAAAPGPGGRSPRVVVGYDNSDHAAQALRTAAQEATGLNAVLEIVCGWPWDLLPPLPDTDPQAPLATSLFGRSREALERAGARLREQYPGLRVVPLMTTESAGAALVRRAAEADLTVVGTRGHGGFASLLLGSVSRHVASHAENPVLVVRGRTDEGRGRVLFGMKTGIEREALRFAFEQARRRGAELWVLHAWDYPLYPGIRPDNESGRALVRLAVAALEGDYPDVSVRVVSDPIPAARHLVDASSAADLVVLAVRRRRGLLGPVTHAVLHHADCPVALVPAS